MDGRWVGWVAAVVCETDCGQCEEDLRFRLERAPSTTNVPTISTTTTTTTVSKVRCVVSALSFSCRCAPLATKDISFDG